jgi:hypothetical protein
LRDLPLWRADITNSVLNPSVAGVFSNPNVVWSSPTPGCKLYTQNTTGGCNASSSGGVCPPNAPPSQFNTWRRVGQPSDNRSTDANIYGAGIDTNIGSAGFEAMYSDTLPSGVTRQVYDWFIAMNSFDYSVAQSIMVDENDNAQLCFRIDIADEYAWYGGKAGKLDFLMAVAEGMGVGTHYDIRGSSIVLCENFKVGTYNFQSLNF